MINILNKKLLALVLLISAVTLFAYSDSDMDGVEDQYDKCPNTPFSDLVNLNGCTVKKLGSSYSFDVVYGINYADSNIQTADNLYIPAASLRVDMYYKDFSFQASSSYYVAVDNNNDTTTGMYDTYIGGSYKIKPRKDLLVSVGATVILPTYDTNTSTNNTDYQAYTSVSYFIDKASLFAGYSYTFINDEVIGSVGYAYQNTSAYTLGVGYNVTSKLYASVAYHNTESIFTGVEDLQTASLYSYYTISRRRFFIFSYAYGLSDSANQNSFTALMGFYF